MTNDTTNNASPGLYKQLFALDRERHTDLKLLPSSDRSFAADLLLIPIVNNEFGDTCREYPIVFLRDAGQTLIAVALAGVPNGKNLFVDADGQWQAGYIPAFVRRHPFVFIKTSPEQLTVCIDEASKALSRTEGTPLFAADGAQTPLLEKIIADLSAYEQQAQFTLSFVQRLEASGVLVTASAQAELDGNKLVINDLLMVDENKLRALPEATIKEWFSSGELGLIYAHLISLGNFVALLRRQSRLGATGTSSTSASN